MSVKGPEWSERVRSELGKAVLGKTEIVERLQIALLVGGHVLLEGMPGLAKTLLVKSLGRVLDLKFERIQFTPDLLPSDVVGTMIYMPNTGTFSPHLGPVFANLVLADEINRSPAKVQSALLEAMGERQVTIGGTTHPLPEPFFVMATQNPLEQEGTYPLPEAQTDRFLFKLVLGYPGVEEELEMLHRWGGVSKTPSLTAVSSGVELMSMRAQIDSIHVAPAIERYIVDLIQRSRDLAVGDSASRTLDYGSSPRGTLALFQAARALAWLRGMDHVVPAIVQELLPDVLRHRIALTYESQAAGSTIEKVISQIIDSVAVP
ncbi:MAG: hypothetical protein RLY56_281 [Pseudomonadota bacterium]|jgi:MoxR-like ATPase